jgi:hypothetical protein
LLDTSDEQAAGNPLAAVGIVERGRSAFPGCDAPGFLISFTDAVDRREAEGRIPSALYGPVRGHEVYNTYLDRLE